MKRFSFITILISVLSLQIMAQSEIDALRFSMVSPGGTARYIGTGGAFGALGGDFSTLSTNPAGIALYRKSEFTITPTLNFSQVQSSFLGNQEEDVKYNFGLGNIGFVFAFSDPNALKESGWMGFQFGFGLNNLVNFNNRRAYEGFNTENSLMSVFLEKANTETNFNSPRDPESFLDDYTTGLAWDTWLLALDTLNNEYFIDMPNNVMQRRVTNTSGSIRELNFSFGSNYSNRLYLGASIGIPFLRFEEEYSFYEENTKFSPGEPGEFSELNSLEYSESLLTTGVGFNFKIGAILRANDMIRLGAALHTPTFYSLEDDWRTYMKSDLLSFGQKESESPNSLFQYELNTPLKYIGSLGLVFGTRGLLSADYEYADYTKMRLRSENDPFTNENKKIQSNFKAQHNLRFGGELRLNPIVLRAGYALHSNPYDDAINNLERTTISGGIGIRDQHYFVDFGYFITRYTDDFYQYYSFNKTRTQPVVNYDFAQQGFMMTVGFRF
jgi:hypothetical protein